MSFTANGFVGPSFRQRLLGFASAATTIMAITEGGRFVGRVVSVDVDNFEMVLRHPTGTLPVGTIVNISFAELNAISPFN